MTTYILHTNRILIIPVYMYMHYISNGNLFSFQHITVTYCLKIRIEDCESFDLDFTPEFPKGFFWNST